MTPSGLDMAKELALAMIHVGALPPDDMQDFIRATHTFLMQLKEKEGAGTVGVWPETTAQAGMDWKKSITQHAITCLECGAVLKQLSIRHLRAHDLTARSYRAKYGIPRTQSLAAKATTARRRQVVQAIRPWEKTRRYLEMQAGTAAVAKKKTVAKRGRKTSPR